MTDYQHLLERQDPFNDEESVDACVFALEKGDDKLVRRWMQQEDKLSRTEELGDAVKQYDIEIALAIYSRALVPQKVLECLTDPGLIGKIDNVSRNSQAFGYMEEDYLFLLETALTNETTSEQGIKLAERIIPLKQKTTSKPVVKVDEVVDIFLKANLVKPCIDLLTDILKENKKGEGALQTRLFEIYFDYEFFYAVELLKSKKLTYFDKNRVAQLCEKYGFILLALEHYQNTDDVRRIFSSPETWKLVASDYEGVRKFLSSLTISEAVQCLANLLAVAENDYSNRLTIAKLASELYYDQFSNVDVVQALHTGGLDQEILQVCEEGGWNAERVQFLLRLKNQQLWSDYLRPGISTESYFTAEVTSLALGDDPDGAISCLVEAFHSSNLPNDLEALLKALLLDTNINNRSLKTLLLFSAIRLAATSSKNNRVMDYAMRLDDYDGIYIAKLAELNDLFEEAFAIYRTFGDKKSAMMMLLQKIGDLNRAREFAQDCNDPAIWALLPSDKSTSSKKELAPVVAATSSSPFVTRENKGESQKLRPIFTPSDGPVFTPRQGFDEKLPPVNVHKPGLITKKYANHYFTGENNAVKLSDSVETFHNIQNNEQNKRIYLQTIRNAIKKIRFLRHYDNLEAHQAVDMLAFSANRQLSTEIGIIMVEEKLPEMLVHMLKRLTNSNIFMTELTWAVATGILVIMSDYSHKNYVFANQLAEAGVIPVLLFNLQRKPALGTSKGTDDIITLCIATLYSISSVPECLHYFDKNKEFKILRTMYQSSSNTVQLLATMTMVNILSDHDPSRLLIETGSVRYLVEALEEFARNINSKKKRHARNDGILTSRSVRSPSPSEDDSGNEGNIFTDDQPLHQGVNLDSLELLKTLARLSIHDSHKSELIKLGILKLYASFLRSKKPAEQSMAAYALWSLVSGSNMGADVASLTELAFMDDVVSLLRNLAERSSDSSLRFNCQALVWLIENRDYKGPSNNASGKRLQPLNNDSAVGQIFISYASSSGEIVTRITKKLHSVGFIVQSDLASGPDSLPLPATIATIEASDVVLLCFSERYKFEPRCRCEAEIVNQTHRPAIYMRADFHLNLTSWVNTLLAHRDTVDVSGRRYIFEEGLKRLLRLMGLSGVASEPLTQRRPPKRETVSLPLPAPPQQVPVAPKITHRNTRVVGMQRDDVQKWLNTIGLKYFADRFSRYDGQMLNNLYVLNQSAPEFICQALSAKLDGDLDNVVLFFTALNKLYE